MKKISVERLVPDTSAIINSLVTEKLKAKELEFKEIIIHHSLLAELEHQANKNRESGFMGLDELNRLNALEKKDKFLIRYEGARPTETQIKYAKSGEIDAVIRQLAWDFEATLLTCDKVQAEVAKAVGMNILFFESVVPPRELTFLKFFKKDYMSVHVKEGEGVYAKKGVPGNWEFVSILKKMGVEEIEKIAEEIIDAARNNPKSYLEVERPGSVIAQLENFRIVITKPPLSDGWEITLVRPVRQLSLRDYKLSDKLLRRISEKAEGVLVAGAPGAGKSTFLQALAHKYITEGKVLKSLESPRDLQLPATVTQYSLSKGRLDEFRDILLLVRPDYTIFDEMRNTADFKFFGDMRLSGVGMIGVVHGTAPLEAVQRFIGRLELGMISHVIDTVIFIKDGQVGKVLSLNMTVKVPSGMKDEDLARPVVEVYDFETGVLEYEIYPFGDQTMVLPVEAGAAIKAKSKKDQLLEKALAEDLTKRLNMKTAVEVTSANKISLYIPESAIGQVLGTKGERIKALEEEYGVGIDVKPYQEAKRAGKIGEGQGVIKFRLKETKKHLTIQFDIHSGVVDLMVDSKRIASLPIDRSGRLKIFKSSKTGKIIADALRRGGRLRFV